MNSIRPRERGRRSIARVVLALLLVAMAVGQVADFPGFIDVLRDYDLGLALLAPVVAVGLVAGEGVGGVLLLRRDAAARARGAVAALGVAIAWSALALTAFARSEGVPNCGCFGVYLAQPLRWWTLVEDLEFVALSAFVLFSGRRSSAEGSGRPRTGFRRGDIEGASNVRTPQAR